MSIYRLLGSEPKSSIFVIKSRLENIHMAGSVLIRLGDSIQLHFLVLILQVLIEKHRVIALFLRLHLLFCSKGLSHKYTCDIMEEPQKKKAVNIPMPSFLAKIQLPQKLLIPRFTKKEVLL